MRDNCEAQTEHPLVISACLSFTSKISRGLQNIVPGALFKLEIIRDLHDQDSAFSDGTYIQSNRIWLQYFSISIELQLKDSSKGVTASRCQNTTSNMVVSPSGLL